MQAMPLLNGEVARIATRCGLTPARLEIQEDSLHGIFQSELDIVLLPL